MKTLLIISGLIMLVMFNKEAAVSQTRDRAQIPEKYTWDLTPVYPSEEAYQKAKGAMVAKFDQILTYKGKLGQSANQLYACLNLNSEISKEASRLYSYVSFKSDLDTRDTKYLGMRQELSQLLTDYSTKAAFIQPEILEIDPAKLNKFIASKKELKVFEFYIKDLLRSKAHLLSEKEEKIIAETGLFAGAPSTIYSLFSNAEFPFPEIVLSDGKKVKIDLATFATLRALPVRADRELVFHSLFGKIYDFRRTFGATMDANIKRHLFTAHVRNYNSCLETSLDANNIPTEVYQALIKNVNDNLATFHRYLKIKQQMLGVDTLKYTDLYAPVVKDLDLSYPIETAQTLILEALQPLGSDYTKTVQKAFDERWIDVYPTPAKRSGAYSNGSVYDVHPYILLNYNEKYDDVSTLAHELGHTMHSYYSNKTQPYPLSDYSIFVAEVASTFNEVLLFHDNLNKITDPNQKLTLLMNYLDGIKGTVFRQTQFAEFELRMHEMAERGEQLTGDSLTELYKQIVRAYYGHDKGVCYVDDIISIEWAYIPHFYYNFYVYQYATSFTAATALAKKVMENDKTARSNYLKFISSGGSDYPINLLKKAGVDMTTADPFTLTMKEMNWVMDEIEKVLAKK
ncbi:MAG: oligoendopeptidase F [Candidatus Marinimicrobia bacterium]|nr:oligoendopeptidase F [Candidatus Neomarinimicrobiota bacterium]